MPYVAGSLVTKRTNFVASDSVSLNVGSNPDRFVCALVWALNGDTSGSRSLTAATYGGNALTISSVFSNGMGRFCQLVYGVTTLTGSNTLAVTATNNSGEIYIAAAAFDAVDQTAPVSGVAQAATDNASPQVTVSSSAADVVIALLAQHETTDTLTTGSGTTEVATATAHIGRQHLLSEAGGESVTIGGTYPATRSWSMIGFSLNLVEPPAPPVISDGSATVTSPTASSVQFSTDSLSDGTAYVRARIGGSPASAATIIAEGVSQAVSGSNPQTVAMTGLTAGGAYHYDIVQDGADGESNVLTVGPVTMWPGLSAATVTLTSDTAANVGVTTTTSGGTLYRYRSSNASESASTVKTSGTTSTPSASGAQGPFASTGMTAGQTYYWHWVHTANGGDSAVLSAGPIYPGTWRTTADVTVTGWTASAGSDLFALIDEDSASEVDFITATDISTAQEAHFTLSRAAPPGDYIWRVRAAVSSGTGTLRVTMRDGSGNSVGASSDQAITTTPTTYDIPVTATGEAVRVSFRLLAD